MSKKHKVIFQYFQKDYVTLNNEDEKLINILHNFSKAINININELCFYIKESN